MKVLVLNGSPRKNGNTTILIDEALKVFEKEGIEYKIIDVGQKAIRGCAGCGYCSTHDECAIKDEVNDAAKYLKEADGVLVASPVYYASPNGTLISFLDRLFYSNAADLRMKVGAAFAVARRGGTEATFDVLNKYFTISQMPIASGMYWNNGFGGAKGQIADDKEGLQNARVVAKNMVFLMKSIALGKEQFGLPESESKIFTSFMR